MGCGMRAPMASVQLTLEATVTIKEIVRRTGYSRGLARKVLRGYCPDGGAHRSEVILKSFLRTMGREPFRIPGGPRLAACRSVTDRNTPRLRLRLVRMAKKPSTALSQEDEVGVKWKVQRGWRASHWRRRDACGRRSCRGSHGRSCRRELRARRR